MLKGVKVEDVLFLDIETVPGVPAFADLDEMMQSLWDKKSAYFRKPDETAADAFDKAGIYAEFGRIVCISVGMAYIRDGKRCFRLKSFASDNEKELLTGFATMLTSFSADPTHNICGHNIKEFDIPYIARRMLINGIELPDIIDVAGKKPWEVKFLDTLEMWKFGDYKNYTSLNLLTAIFGIKSPKDDIDGSQVAGVYYRDNDLKRIATYCEKDVFATAQLFLRFKGEPLIDDSLVEHSAR
jgi:DNA polymerase elongation subunit (family B)